MSRPSDSNSRPKLTEDLRWQTRTKCQRGLNIHRKFLLRFSVLTTLTIPFLALLLLSKAYLPALAFTVLYLFFCYFLYLRHVRRVRSKYPLAPPILEQDVYFPRTNIPRPIHKDYREHPEYFDKKKKDRKTS